MMGKLAKSVVGVGLCGVLSMGAIGLALAAEPGGAAAGSAAMKAAGEPAGAVGSASSGEPVGVGKQQVVYIKQDASGAQEGVYVVNAFDADDASSVSDAGDYESVTNLSDEQELSVEGGAVSFEVADGGTFRYQGDMAPDTATPWVVSVSYSLDGRAVEADELAGATGAVEIGLSIQPNDACDAGYADNYLLQATVALPNDAARGIVADGATEAQSGNDTQLTYMVFPGSSADYRISFEAQDFTYDGFQLVGVPLSIALEVSDEEMEGATGDLDELSDAAGRLNEGASSVKDGAGTLDEGAASLAASGEGLSQGASSVADAFDRLQAGSAQLADAVEDRLVPAMGQLAQGSAAYASQLDQRVAALQQQTQGMDAAQAQAAYEQALAAFAANPQNESAQAELQDAQALLTAVNVSQALQTARAGYEDIDAGIQEMADADSNSGAAALAEGARSVANGVDAARAGYLQLQTGLDAYLDGVGELRDGADELLLGAGDLAQGTDELFDRTRGLDQRLIESVRERLEDYLNPRFQPVDFANGSTDVERVQFVYKTAGI